jgi:hypothetical protein
VYILALLNIHLFICVIVISSIFMLTGNPYICILFNYHVITLCRERKSFVTAFRLELAFTLFSYGFDRIIS